MAFLDLSVFTVQQHDEDIGLFTRRVPKVEYAGTVKDYRNQRSRSHIERLRGVHHTIIQNCIPTCVHEGKAMNDNGK